MSLPPGFITLVLTRGFGGAGANGRTGKEWRKLLPYLQSRLGSDCNVSFLFSFFRLIIAQLIRKSLAFVSDM